MSDLTQFMNYSKEKTSFPITKRIGTNMNEYFFKGTNSKHLRLIDQARLEQPIDGVDNESGKTGLLSNRQ